LTTPARVDDATLPDERRENPARGTVRFRTPILAPDTATAGLVCGVAIMSAGQGLALHSHSRADVTFGLEGEGNVPIDGLPHSLTPLHHCWGGAWRADCHGAVEMALQLRR
jgi:quercetin dioxygenase-like cupin family protein